MFLSLDLLSEYRIQHGAIGPLYVTFSNSTRIFCRGVSGFATDCHCDVWCSGLTTCLLHVGPPFGNRFLNTSWAVGLTDWIGYLHFFSYFGICNDICLHTSYHFLALSFLLNILYVFKYCCTNIFHRRSLSSDLLSNWLVTWPRQYGFPYQLIKWEKYNLVTAVVVLLAAWIKTGKWQKQHILCVSESNNEITMALSQYKYRLSR